MSSAVDMATMHMLMQGMLVIWIWLVARIVRRSISNGSVGLPAALVLIMSFLYGGSFVYAVPGYTHLRFDGNAYLQAFNINEWMVVKATFVSLLGLTGIAIGCGAFLPRRAPRSRRQRVTVSRSQERQMLTLLGGIGLASFTLHYLEVQFPMSEALLEMGRNVAVATICIGAYLAYRDGRSVLVWQGLASLIPLYYLLVWGFVSFGFLVGITVLAFWLTQMRRVKRRPTWRDAVIIIAVAYLAITLFVSWMSVREAVRLLIWSGASGSIFDILMQAATQTELFSISNFAVLDLVNIRLNLNLYIGLMMERHEFNPDLRAYGATLFILPLALLPRLLWPEKPERGGTDFIGEHTGVMFSEGVTFGSGMVFEFYVNFGYLGVFVCCVILGWLIKKIDQRAYRALARGDIFDFARFFVIGIAALDPLQRPFFTFNSILLAWLVLSALKFVIPRRSSYPVGRVISPGTTTDRFKSS